MLTDTDRAFVVKAASPFLPEVQAVILGGSQVHDDGLLRVPSSDHDVILFGPYIRHPTSLVARDPSTGKKYDLILRDSETFNWDVQNEAMMSGVGTLLHIAATGVFVGMPHETFANAKANAEDIFKQGPYPVDARSLTKICHRLRSDIIEASCLKDAGARLAANLCIAHKTGVVASRAKRLWVGKGKILGRFLHDWMPEYKTRIVDAFRSSFSGENIAFYHLANWLPYITPLPCPDSFPKVPFSTPVPTGRPETKAETFYHCRRNIGQCYSFLRSPIHGYNSIAQHWMQRKHAIVAGAVDPSRKGRESNEYFFALARMTEFFLFETACLYHHNPTKLSLQENSKLAAGVYPSLGKDLMDAIEGEPQAFLQKARETLNAIAPTRQNLIMQSPPTHRLKA